MVPPVEILFGGTLQTDPPSWKRAYMRYTKTEEVPIGDNGATFVFGASRMTEKFVLIALYR